MDAINRLRILLIGSGGREHALAWKLSQSPRVDTIYVVPGNGGTARGLDKVENVDTVKADDFPGLVAFAKENDVNLLVPGPEATLVAGIESHFRKGKCKRKTYLSKRPLLMAAPSRHPMLWTESRGCPHGRLKDFRQRFHGSMEHSNRRVSEFQQL